MSRRFLNFVKFNMNVNIDGLSTYTILGMYVLIIGGHACYAYGTAKNKIIVIDKKYKFTRNGFTEFMIIDKEGHHYNVNNSIWYWKWDSIEDWYLIKEEQKLNTLTYGWRVPILGMFPNIVSSQYNKKKQ